MTVSRIAAEPATDKIKHDNHAKGESINWHIKTSSAVKSKVSGIYNLESVHQTICRFRTHKPIRCCRTNHARGYST